MLRRLRGFFNRSRVLGYCALLLAGEAALGGAVIAKAYDVFAPTPKPVMTDFVSFYAAGRLAAAGAPALAYNRKAHYAAETADEPPGSPYNYFYYPPVFLLLCAALARLPYIAAFLVFEAATLALYALVAVKTVGPRGWKSAVPLLAFPAVVWNFGFGQNAFLTAALFGGGLLLLERRPLIAGVVFGALIYKPQFALLLPVALISAGSWRAVAGAAISGVALVALSLVLLGPGTWNAFLASALAAHHSYEHSVRLGAFVSPFGGVLVLAGRPALAYAVQAAASVAAVVAVVLAWRRRAPPGLRAAVLASGTLIAFPVVMYYDLLLGALAAAWLWREEGSFSPGEQGILMLLFVACIDPVIVAQQLRVPMGAIMALALFGMVIGRLWHYPAAEPLPDRAGPPTSLRGGKDLVS